MADGRERKRLFFEAAAKPLRKGKIMEGIIDPLANWAFFTQEQRNATYNNAAAVTTSAELIKARDDASARYRLAHNETLDLLYGASNRQAWDLFSSADELAPCMVFFHGGYWQMNGRENFACVAEGLAAYGWSVALPGYTLAPEAGLRRIVSEIWSALNWLQDYRFRHSLHGKVIVTGWSAGAQLAALALAHPIAEAGLAISGVYDLAPLRDTYLNAKLSLSEKEIADLSPTRLPVVDKPMTICYGSNELPALIREAREFHRLRAEADAPGSLLSVPHANHYSILDALTNPNGLLTRAVIGLAGVIFTPTTYNHNAESSS